MTVSNVVPVLTNNSFNNSIGQSGTGRMTVSNGLVSARQLNLGVTAGAGTLTMAGGTNTVSQSMTLGNFTCTAIGTVIVDGGRLDVTNAAHNAVLDVRSGTVTLDSGTLTIDQLVITNACGHFIKTGGTLSITSTNLAANLDADGDGIPNVYELGHSLDPFDSADADLDPDGDGFTNLEEFLAGTDPTNSASALRITSAVRTNNSIRVTWITGSGRTNALQRTAGNPDGSYSTNSFVDIFTVTNTVGTITNFLDVGAATNSPSRFYRVRLVP